MGRLVAAAAALSLVAVGGCATHARGAAGSSVQSPSPSGFGASAGTASASTGTASPGPGVSPSATPPPPDHSTAPQWQARYALLDHYPDFAYCDPDLYPVARGDEQSAADDWWAHTNHDSPEARTILARHHDGPSLSAAQRLTAYRDHKKLTVIVLTTAPGGYNYQLPISSTGNGEPDRTVTGTIIGNAIHELTRRPRPGGCPICLQADTRIATPRGDIPAADIKPGDLVWTTDAAGNRIAAPVVKVVRRATPGPHLMLRLALSDGRVLVAAGAHPAADGSYLRALRVGQFYDGASIAAIGWVPSTAPATYDLLAVGVIGDYWANGILVGSTLSP